MRAQAQVAAPDAPIPPGSFDEHLALDGVQESQLWEGDLLRFPDCTLVVSVPRLPDARFNETLGFVHAAKMVAQSRWSGFWLSVRVPGTIAAGQPFELIPGPRATGTTAGTGTTEAPRSSIRRPAAPPPGTGLPPPRAPAATGPCCLHVVCGTSPPYAGR